MKPNGDTRTRHASYHVMYSYKNRLTNRNDYTDYNSYTEKVSKVIGNLSTTF